MQLLLLPDRSLQIREFELLPKDVQQIDLLPLDPPGRANAVIAELSHLVGRVPTLHDTIEFRQLMRRVATKPCQLDEPAAGRHR